MSKSANFFFVLVVLMTSACQLDINAGSSSEEPLSQSTNTPVPPTPSAETFSGQMVVDNRVGFTFYYPEGWSLFSPGDVSSATAYAYSMQSFEAGPGGGGLPPNMTKVDLYVNPSDSGASLATIQTRLAQENLDDSISLTLLSTEVTSLENGMDALLVRGTGMGGDFVSIHIMVKGYEVIATVLGDEQYLWDIMNSLREVN
jgi:hypothetical protein